VDLAHRLIAIFEMPTEYVEIAKNNFPIFFYLVTFFLSLKYYRKYFDTVLKYLPLILAYTLLNELLGHIIRYSSTFAIFPDRTVDNDIIYNVYDLIYFGFYFHVLWQLVESQKKKNLIKWVSFAVLTAYLINCIFQNPFEISLYYAYTLASFALVLFSIMYLSQLQPYPGPSIKKYNLMYWITIGLVIFHSIFPILFITGYLKPAIWYDYEFQTIGRILIVVMNIIFCYGFFRARKKSFQNGRSPSLTHDI